MRRILFLLGLTLATTGTLAQAYTEQREMHLDTAGLEKMSISCGAGALQVEGTRGEDIRVTAEIQINGLNAGQAETFARENIELWLRKEGSLARLKSEIHKDFPGSARVTVDLTVQIPARLHLDIRDESGAIEVLRMQGNMRVRDGSGEIRIRDAGGNLDVDDGSGGIDIRQVRGTVALTDGSGNIDVQDLQGNAVIRDGSGSISVARVEGDLTIRDGSGSITVRQVRGEVIVDDGSGSMDIRDVDNGVIIESDSSGSRRISRVRGHIIERE